MFKLGNYQFDKLIALAPMAGISDLPMRQLALQFGANYAPTEMVSSQTNLIGSGKSQARLQQLTGSKPVAVQIVGTCGTQMAQAAAFYVELGAEIIDINMGCPAKKVCSVQAGSALMADEKLVADILNKVVNSVAVPVTLKMRTGVDRDHKNALNIAKIAADAGIAMLCIHGRTRQDKFMYNAEYDTIANIKQQLSLPIIANGDIDSATKAAAVLAHTKADGIMIGRHARGNPWIFQQVLQQMENKPITLPTTAQIIDVFLQHIAHIHRFYGCSLGKRLARKHIGWWFMQHQILRPHFKRLKMDLFNAPTAALQYALLEQLHNLALSKRQTAI